MNVVLTRRQKEYVAQKVRSGHYASASEVVREALRVLEDMECDRAHLEGLLDEADLEPAMPGGPAFWKKLRSELRAEGRKRSAA
jgi:antitoxin ParD1/3/4